MNKLLIALFSITGLSVLTPAMAHADGISISFSTGYPVYAAPVTSYQYLEYQPRPEVIVVHEHEHRDYSERGYEFGHDRGYHNRHERHERHERCGHAEREHHEYRQDNYRGTGYGYSGYNYQPAPVIQRVDTNPRLYR